MLILPNLFNVIPIKFPKGLFVELDELIPKFISKSTRITKEILRKKKTNVGLDLPDIKSYFKTTVTKTVRWWSRHRHKPMEQQRKSPKCIHMYMQMHVSLIQRNFRCIKCLYMKSLKENYKRTFY